MLVEMLADRLKPQGFEVTVIRPRAHPDRASLLAVHQGNGGGGGGGGGRSLLLNGHLDTVGVSGMTDPFTPRIEGDRRTGTLFGRGACDMKAGVAAMVVAAEAAASAGLDGDLMLALVADEENASLGTDSVIAHLRASSALPDAALVAEPTWLNLAVAHRGFAVVEVDLTGRAAHSSQPHEGVNAVTHLGRLLSAVERRAAALLTGPGHPHVGHASMMVTAVRGGESPFVIPDHAQAVIERRTVPGELATIALDEINGILAQLHEQDPTVEATAATSLARPAWQVSSGAGPATDLSDLLRAALTHWNSRTPSDVGAPYWMESALWEEAGVPAVVCGPAGGGLHADIEWVELAQVRGFACALHDVIVAFCSTPEN